MRRPIGWAKRDSEGKRRQIRVHIHAGALRWDTRLPHDACWQRQYAPTAADWETLLETVENWYRRRSATHEVLELVRKLKLQADAAHPPAVSSGPIPIINK